MFKSLKNYCKTHIVTNASQNTPLTSHNYLTILATFETILEFLFHKYFYKIWLRRLLFIGTGHIGKFVKDIMVCLSPHFSPDVMLGVFRLFSKDKMTMKSVLNQFRTTRQLWKKQGLQELHQKIQRMKKWLWAR